MPKTKKSFEENIQTLEQIIARLENGDAKLDECIDLYEKGVALSKECIKMLYNDKQKVNIVTQQNTQYKDCE
ncbi:MAG: exodeoxyribonuclease VII small subunit [Clostridia bacterium]|nr:exodeoxyribonuclease VII small subunit [Clostridia bacterium]